MVAHSHEGLVIPAAESHASSPFDRGLVKLKALVKRTDASHPAAGITRCVDDAHTVTWQLVAASGSLRLLVASLWLHVASL